MTEVESDTRVIVFTTPTGERAEPISFSAAKRSKFVLELCHDVEDEEIELEVRNQDNEPAPTVAILNLVNEYLRHFETMEPTEIEKPLPNGDLMQQLMEWEKRFICEKLLEGDGDPWQHGPLVQVMYVASSLSIDPLVSLTTSWIAQEIANICRQARGPLKAAAKIREFLHIPGNGGWSEEQLKALEVEADWFEDIE